MSEGVLTAVRVAVKAVGAKVVKVERMLVGVVATTVGQMEMA